MCGFVGFTAVDFDRETNKAVVKDMADRIAHRGPDDEGFFVDDDIAMGFRRLSIIDLEGSRQPMQNADGTVTVTFNGEIYNFQELRAELEALGYAFVTNGDTETIVHGYEAWGTDVFEKLRGMFAIAIWDAPKKRLVCARDLFGITTATASSTAARSRRFWRIRRSAKSSTARCCRSTCASST